MATIEARKNGAAQTVADEQGDNLSDIIRTKLREYIEQQGTT